MGKPKIERRVLRIFGKVIRPANWIMFLLGVVFVVIAVYQLAWGGASLMDFLILLSTGLTLAGQGYGEVKEDEDV